MSNATPFVGSWRITHMDVWDMEAVDLLGPGHFTFKANGTGSFQFIAVTGSMHCRFTKTGSGVPRVTFTWEGNDEMDDASGAGSAEIHGSELRGEILFHAGDDSGFVAKRGRTPRRPKGTR